MVGVQHCTVAEPPWTPLLWHIRPHVPRFTFTTSPLHTPIGLRTSHHNGLLGAPHWRTCSLLPTEESTANWRARYSLHGVDSERGDLSASPPCMLSLSLSSEPVISEPTLYALSLKRALNLRAHNLRAHLVCSLSLSLSSEPSSEPSTSEAQLSAAARASAHRDGR